MDLILFIATAAALPFVRKLQPSTPVTSAAQRQLYSIDLYF